MTNTVSRRGGMTLVEVLIVIGLFSALFSVMVGIMHNSDTFFNKGQQKITGQMEARKVVDTLTRNLRAGAPDWIVNATHYPLSVTENFSRLDYYAPVFDSLNAVSGVKKITYKLDPMNPKKLLVKEGAAPESVISECVDSIRFGAGCAGCASYDCNTPAEDCPVVSIDVATRAGDLFHLSTKIALRNRILTVAGEFEVDTPGEGEF